MAQTTNLLNIDSILFQLRPLAYGNNDNDGMVGRYITHLGRVIRDNYTLNHIDLANMRYSQRFIGI